MIVAMRERLVFKGERWLVLRSASDGSTGALMELPYVPRAA